jgi:predicted DNA-binding protein (MmcQ/YjbR family)
MLSCVATHKDQLLTYCRRLPAATEDIKWGQHVCFSVGHKLFVIFGEDLRQFTVKVDPSDFAPLTALEGIIPAPYLARAGWVTADTAAGVNAAMARKLLLDSWRLVAERLSARVRRGLGFALVSPEQLQARRASLLPSERGAVTSIRRHRALKGPPGGRS